MAFKRLREEDDGNTIERAAMANCLMLLSQLEHQHQLQDLSTTSTSNSLLPDRLFTCKTCNRKFTSFQALGGHRASHKKIKLVGGDDISGGDSTPKKPKTHQCSICGVGFPIGQALGGHMRRHRAAIAAANSSSLQTPTVTPSGTTSTTLQATPPHLEDEVVFPPSLISQPTRLHGDEEVLLPAMEKSSSKRALHMDLDLNLSLRPLGEIDFLDLRLGTAVNT
ncbi:hypothetical protein Ancab_011679 [Ancistrocladus abbreviatus]